MGIWLTELRRNLPSDIILHVVGTKADIVTRDPTRREVPFESCIAYVAENLAPGLGSTPPPTATPAGFGGLPPGPGTSQSSMGATATATTTTTVTSSGHEPRSPSSKRSSGFWAQEAGWDACHEISAESGEGVDEVFRVVTRKLVEQNRKIQQAILAATATPDTPGYEGGGGAEGAGGYFDGTVPRGSFRVGRENRRSWLFSPGFSPSVTIENAAGAQQDAAQNDDPGKRQRRCC